MTTRVIRDFYPNGRIKYEYFRDNLTIKDLRCWEENGDPIRERDIKYEYDDSDADLSIRLKYICQKLPVPRFTKTPTVKSRFVVMGKDGPYYGGVDF